MIVESFNEMQPVCIAHLYPDLLNLYGDRGNLITLRQRMAWRGIASEIEPIGIGDDYDPDRYDITFIGGGQDYEQSLLHTDLIDRKKPAIREAVENGRVFLCICGGFQLMGQSYRTHEGQTIECLGLVDFYTQAGPDRLIGDTVYDAPLLRESGVESRLYGFENHSGRTWLGAGVRPLATVISGHGNNGEDKTEGAIYKNVYCTYSHGSFLPKNPEMADYLIVKAIQSQFPTLQHLPTLDITMEENARKYLESCNK